MNPTIASQSQVLTTNKLIRNTYTLLAMAMAVCSVTAAIAVALRAPPVHFIILLVGFYGLYFGIVRMRNSAWALLLMLALSAFLGYTLGPILNHYLSIPGGQDIIAMAFGTTAAVFLGLSGYALMSRKDFSFFSGFIMAGMIVLLVAIVASLFFQVPGLALAISVGIAMIYSCVILFETSRLIRDPNANYILAAASLFIAVYNLFLSFLHIFGTFNE